MSNIQIKCLIGPQINAYITALARLRIEIFRDFPYLYQGSMAYEQNYLQAFSQSPESVIVLALNGADVVGASTGMPLEQEDEAFISPFIEHGYNPARIFYFAESVLRAPYRGRGIGARFFKEREAYARRLNRFDFVTFCAVERPLNHPRRPKNYVPLDKFWQKRGFSKHPELITHYSWQDLDDADESLKPMVFWMKSLPAT